MPPIAQTRFAAIRSRLELFEPRAGWRAWLYEFLLFGFKQGWACLFGGLMLFVWLAGNIATFSNALIYPSQRDGWALVQHSKLGAWYLLMYISFILVAVLHKPQQKA